MVLDQMEWLPDQRERTNEFAFFDALASLEMIFQSVSQDFLCNLQCKIFKLTSFTYKIVSLLVNQQEENKHQDNRTTGQQDSTTTE